MRCKRFYLSLSAAVILLMMQSYLPNTGWAAGLDNCIRIYQDNNYQESAKCFSALAGQGNFEAMTRLGLQYSEGRGVAQSPQQAAGLFKKAADGGWAEAQFYLGLSYLRGQGVNQDFPEALKLFRSAASQGHSGSKNAIGNMHRDGRGVAQDFTEAAKWYKQAAGEGLASAQSEYGFFLLTGRGVAQDYDEAAKWFRKAAEQGLAVAQVNLAYCYEFGMGVPLDYDEAGKWLNRAIAQGNQDAKNRLANLERQHGKLHSPRLSDADYLSLARIAEERYNDCQTALNSYLEVSEQGRKAPEWSLSTARSFECVKNYKEALYYYRKYDAMKPRQTRIANKIEELKALELKEQKVKTGQQGAAPAPQANIVSAENCLVQCLQTRSSCGAKENCLKAFEACAASCKEADSWTDVLNPAAQANVTDIQHASFPDYTRIEISLSNKIEFTKARILNPDRLFIDLKNSKIRKDLQKIIKVADDRLMSIRTSQFSDSAVRVVLDIRETAGLKVFTSENPIRLKIYLYR